MAFSIIGTLSHEFGHFTVAKLSGYDANIDYKSCHYDLKNQVFIDSIYYSYYSEINNGKEFPGKEKYYNIIEARQQKGFWIVLAGPLQTMLTGTIAFLFLVRWRKRFYAASRLNFKQWLLIFLSLFWLRQTFNLVMALGVYALRSVFPSRGDEFKLAAYFHIHPLTILLPTGVIGIAVLAYVIFKIIPISQQMPFLVAGLLGGALGFYLWMYLVGPVLMP
jgi:hypothetical protein